MKKIFITALLICAFNTIINAQEWFNNLEDAKIRATKENKNIVVVFQGSDWCTPCIKLDREIWSNYSFKQLAENHFVMVKADFPKKKANRPSKEQEMKNNYLAEKFNSNGFFPYVVIIKPNEKILGSMGYEKTSPEMYFKKMTSFEK